jgi:molybdopterin converting factor small subunit
MKVRVKAFGQMNQYLGAREREVELAEGSRLSDLMLYLEKHWRSQIPDFLWDEVKHGFHGPVVIMINGKAIIDLRTALSQGQEVELHKVLVGG